MSLAKFLPFIKACSGNTSGSSSSGGGDKVYRFIAFINRYVDPPEVHLISGDLEEWDEHSAQYDAVEFVDAGNYQVLPFVGYDNNGGLHFQRTWVNLDHGKSVEGIEVIVGWDGVSCQKLPVSGNNVYRILCTIDGLYSEEPSVEVIPGAYEAYNHAFNETRAAAELFDMENCLVIPVTGFHMGANGDVYHFQKIWFDFDNGNTLKGIEVTIGPNGATCRKLPDSSGGAPG